MFRAWGRFVHRWRFVVLPASLVLLVLSVAAVLQGGNLNARPPGQSVLESDRAQDLVTAQLSNQSGPTGSTFQLVFKSSTLMVTDPQYQSALEAAVAPLRGDHRVTGVDTPYSVPDAQRAALISRDGHEAVANVSLKDDSQTAQDYYDDLRGEVHSDVLSIQGTGDVPLNGAFTSTANSDLRRAELVSLPLTLILLLLIFGGIIAALLPLGVGVLTILGGLAGTLLLSHSMFVSQYALNIVTLIGLGVSIDYSLFVVNRFRDELAGGASREDALATTMATAGRAITFSGLTVVIGLSALLFFQGTFLASVGLAGALVVGVAVLYGLMFLPALLAIIGGGVNKLRLPFIGRRPATDRGFWHGLAAWVMRRPVAVLVPALAVLLLVGSPFLGIKLANGTQDNLPPGNEARQGYDTLVRDFPGQDETTFSVVVNFGHGDPNAAANTAAVDTLRQDLAGIPDVLRVDPPQVGTHIALLNVVTNQRATSDSAYSILSSIRASHVDGATLLVSGDTAATVDVLDYLKQKGPLALTFLIVATLLLLFLATGSFVLPVKAVLMNLLSITASFGALVWIFQQGHLSAQLGFTAQPIDPLIPVIMFAIVFGLSMDYEVLLISRIQEEHRRGADTATAVARGLQRSGRLITGAAAIMIGVFVAFGLADELLIKAIGLGLAIAVAVDATVVRGLVVPSVMRLMGDLNWWAPGPVARLYARFNTQEPHDPTEQSPGEALPA
jgi:putative drug exporter of the RND superfamily